MQRHASASLVAVIVVLAAGSTAHAQEDDDANAQRLPVAIAQRPLTLPALVLAPSLDFDTHRQGSAASGTYGDLDVAASFGVTDDVTLHALVAPLELWSPSGGVRYGETTANHGPGVGATLRLLRGTVELGGTLTGRVFTVPGLSGGAVSVAVPVLVHATAALRFDVDPSVNVWLGTRTMDLRLAGTDVIVTQRSSANAVRIGVPVTASYDVTESFDVGVNTGLTVYDVSDTKNTTGIPLGAHATFAVPGEHGPVADLRPYFNFPYLLMPGRSSVTNSGQWLVGLSVTGFLYW